MASTISTKTIFSAEDRAVINPFREEYLKVKTSGEHKHIANKRILPAILAKWRQVLAPGEELDTKEASRVCIHHLIRCSASVFTKNTTAECVDVHL